MENYQPGRTLLGKTLAVERCCCWAPYTQPSVLDEVFLHYIYSKYNSLLENKRIFKINSF